MLYHPTKGKMKDGCMYYENGKYYLYSMYQKSFEADFNNIWLAVSDDGVHFRDYGCVVEDYPNNIWAMKIHRGNDGYYLNSGSFSESGAQDVLKFWYSTDLLHWSYIPELDVHSPQNEANTNRLDCMNVLADDGKFYGYATGQFCFLESDDGRHWHIRQDKTFRTLLDYHPFPVYDEAGGGFENADILKIGDTYYLLCGGFSHMGLDGYGVYIYSSKQPAGPFCPLLPNYRLNGTSKRWVNMWERCFIKDGEYLAHNYMYDGYSYECGLVYLPPLKKVMRDENGIWLSWWDGNEILKNRDSVSRFAESLIATAPSHNVFNAKNGELTLSDSYPLSDRNTVVEFNIETEANTFVEYSKGGFYLEESDHAGTAILFDTNGKCEIAYVENGRVQFVEDTIGFGCAVPYYLRSGERYAIRLLIRGNLFEIYINNRYLQTFNTTHFEDRAGKPILGIRAAAERKRCEISSIICWKMTL